MSSRIAVANARLHDIQKKLSSRDVKLISSTRVLRVTYPTLFPEQTSQVIWYLSSRQKLKVVAC